ncbi:hypothetical protein [Dyadobacter sp. NIV53]|uniref:hypothetical protein n=1 Tax=Dyadobacter sp. NIV53 TaxID=2861765 RepID=UPI001C868B2F|nr:hypothetical protein [Dyadobacter sp. NIV53]
MKYLPNIIYIFGKFWLAIVLFIAILVSTVVSLPFIIAGKITDVWRSYQLHSSNDHHLTDYSS